MVKLKADWQIIIGLLLFTILALSSVLLTQFTTDIPPRSSVLAWVEQAGFTPDDQTTPQQVSLPHDWKLTDTVETGGFYHFRATFDTDIRDQQPVIYVPHYGQSITLTVNGNAQPTNLITGAQAHNWNTPALIPLDPRHLQTGENIFTLRLTGHPVPGDNYLSKIYIGPRALLEPVWQENHMIRVEVIRTLTTIMLWLSSAMAILFFLRRQETMFGWFALGILCAALYNANFIFAEIPLQYAHWQALIFAALMLSVLFLIVTSDRLSGLSNPRFEKLAFVIAAIGFLPLILPGVAPYWLHSYGFSIWIVLVLIFGLVSYGMILRHRLLQKKGQEALFILAAGTLVASFGLNDILTLNGVLPRERPLLLSYGLFTLIVSQAWFVLTRFAGALNELEDINADLDQRVRAREQELTVMHQAQIEAARERTLAQERERLMQDMHDGVGGRLVSALALLESDGISPSEVREELHKCLEDVRLTIESLDMEAGDLASLLGSFRYQMEPRLKRQNITMKWNVDDLPAGLRLNPAENLHLLRILQEGITNILRHSQADKVTISAGVHHGELQVDLADNGTGFPPQSELRSGRGLGNIRNRATALGGKVTINAGQESEGVKLSLRMPVPASDQKSTD